MRVRHMFAGQAKLERGLLGLIRYICFLYVNYSKLLYLKQCQKDKRGQGVAKPSDSFS